MSSAEEIIENSLGPSGKFQTFIISLLYLHRVWLAWHQILIVIVSPQPGNFTCTLPKFEPCDERCQEHEFDHSVWKRTIVHEWDLVCSRAVLVSVTQMMVMVGILVGSITFGYLGDRFGRRKPLFGACFIQLVAGVLTTFSPNVYVYIFLRFLTTVGTGGTMVPTFALLMEFTDKKYRTTIGVLYMIPVNIGQACLGLIGYYSRDWHYTQLIVSVSSALLLSYIFLPESPRWLLTQKKTDEVVKVLERGAKCNNLPTAGIQGAVEAFVSKSQTESVKGGNCLDLMRTKRMRLKTLIMCFNWAITSMEFFALAQFIGQIGGNVFVNLAIGGAIQMPAIIISVWLIDIIGRKWTVITGYLVIIVPMFLICLLPREPYWPITILSSLAVCGSSINFALVYVYSGELFPTILRSLGMGLCSMSGRLGSMVAPFIMQMQEIEVRIPPAVFAFFPVLAVLLTLLLPETRGTPLPDSVEEADKL